jgi:putative ABC transport system ATP-binding protein
MDRAPAIDDQAVCVSDLAFTWPGSAAFSITMAHFAIAAGESVLLLGESGSGKSTVLSLICGIFPPDSGRVLVDRTDLAQLTPGQRDRFRAEHIGVIFQMFNLLPYASAIENVILPIRFAPARRARLSAPPRQVAAGLLAALGLPQSVIERGNASQLSVGQQQRVAVARALIGAPGLIIADEPTSSLDPDNQARFLDLLFENVGAAGSALLVVSHDDRMAPHFDRTVRLSDVAEISREDTA